MISFKLFGFQIDIGRNKPGFERRIKSGPLCGIRQESGYWVLTDPYGKTIPKQISLKLIDPLNSPPRAIVELFVSPEIIDDYKTPSDQEIEWAKDILNKSTHALNPIQ